MFRKDNKLASVSRMTYTDVGGYKKSSYVSTGKSFLGNLKALTLSDGIDMNAFGRNYEFHTDFNADIKESDRLTIDGVIYDVKGIADFNGVTFSRKMIILNRTENGT